RGEGEPARNHFAGAHPDTEGEVVAVRFSHCGDELEWRPHPVFQAPAVFVVAEVGERGEKLTGQTGVTELNLDPVETAFTHMDGALGKIACHFLDVLRLHRLRGLPEQD